MIAIVATDANWGIGKDNKLLFHIPEDMAFFKEQTLGNVVVMGRKTLESLPEGQPLANRTNLVLTSQTPFASIGTNFYKGNSANIDAMLKTHFYDHEVFIIGGASVYSQYLTRCDRVYRTIVHRIYDADARFPVLPRHNFQFSRVIKYGSFETTKFEIEEWVSMGATGYLMTGAYINDGVAHIFCNNGDGYVDEYGHPYSSDMVWKLGQALYEDESSVIEKDVKEIEPGVWRATYSVSHPGGVTAILDGYGGTEPTAVDLNQVFHNILINW